MNKTKYIVDLGNFLMKNLDNIHYDIDQTNHLYKFYTSFAISKAENSTLTEFEAQDILNSNENLDQSKYLDYIRSEVNSVSVYQKKNQSLLRKLHDKLEYNNILEAIKYIDNNNIHKYISENGITEDILIQLHYTLTYGLDDLFYFKLNDYDPYYPGVFRNRNNIKVGNSYVEDYKNIGDNLGYIYDLSRNIKSIEDIFYIHAKLYNTHAFSNGNKRICRIIEEILLQNIGVEKTLSASHGYYINQNAYINSLVKHTIYNNEFTKWVEFAYSSILLSGLYMLYNQLKELRKDYIYYTNGIDNIKDILLGTEEISIKEIISIVANKRKIGNTSAENIVYEELSIIEDIIFKNNIGKNTLIGLNIKGNEVYNNIYTVYYDVFSEIIKYNRSFLSANPHFIINRSMINN